MQVPIIPPTGSATADDVDVVVVIVAVDQIHDSRIFDIHHTVLSDVASPLKQTHQTTNHYGDANLLRLLRLFSSFFQSHSITRTD